MFKRKFWTAFKYCFLTIASFISIYPFAWMVFSSTNRSVDVLAGRMWFGRHLLQNYRTLLDTTNIWKGFSNSLMIALIVTFFSLVICSLAGYGFEIYHDRAKDAVMYIILLSMMVPFAAVMTPLFMMMASFGLINNYMGVILPSLSTAVLIFLFRQSSHNFPRELVHAARVDGLGELMIFLRMYVPIMRPTYAAAATITFMGSWNSYLWPLIILQRSEAKTLPIVVSNLLDTNTPDYGIIMLGVLITTFPTLILFSVLQRSFVNGILGAVK